MAETAVIYKITNTIEKRSYIGSTHRPIHVRWDEHKKYLNNGLHSCSKLLAAWQRDGAAAFVFNVLEENIPVAEKFNVERVYRRANVGGYN